MKEKVAIGKLFKTIAYATLTLALVCSLAACGKSGNTNNEANSKSPSTQTASQAFNNDGIWYVTSSDDELAKDSIIKNVLVFQNGKVTVYDTCNAGGLQGQGRIVLSCGDLNGLSKEEIIAKATEIDKKIFETYKQSGLDLCKKEATGCLVHVFDDTRLSSLSTDDIIKVVEAMKQQKPDDGDVQDLTYYTDRIKQLNALTYQQPQPVSYTLSIKTDNSGNNAVSETIAFEHNQFNCIYSRSVGRSSEAYNSEAYAKHSEDLKFEMGLHATTIYDTKFGGYRGLVTIIDGDTNPYTLDSRDSKGVTVK